MIMIAKDNIQDVLFLDEYDVLFVYSNYGMITIHHPIVHWFILQNYAI